MDAVLYTHAHADHVLGVDDLRQLNRSGGKHIPIFIPDHAMDFFKNVFKYIFVDDNGPATKPKVLPHVIKDESFNIEGLEITPLKGKHGPYPITGYTFGDLAYLTDVSEIPDETRERVKGTKILFIDMLREKAHSTHMSLDQALREVEIIKPERTYFIHMDT